MLRYFEEHGRNVDEGGRLLNLLVIHPGGDLSA